MKQTNPLLAEEMAECIKVLVCNPDNLVKSLKPSGGRGERAETGRFLKHVCAFSI